MWCLNTVSDLHLNSHWTHLNVIQWAILCALPMCILNVETSILLAIVMLLKSVIEFKCFLKTSLRWWLMNKCFVKLPLQKIYFLQLWQIQKAPESISMIEFCTHEEIQFYKLNEQIRCAPESINQSSCLWRVLWGGYRDRRSYWRTWGEADCPYVGWEPLTRGFCTIYTGVIWRYIYDLTI